tara:strand:+ start:194 stop:361 length:168 start_codon:yes stop_codon:yes gene_type:complete
LGECHYDSGGIAAILDLVADAKGRRTQFEEGSWATESGRRIIKERTSCREEVVAH